MLPTRATIRCSTAPAEVLHTVGVTPGDPRCAVTIPRAPAASATRQIAPKLRGSWAPSRHTIGPGASSMSRTSA